MSETLPITDARGQLGQLVRRASHGRSRITITDHGEPAAVLISADELADLEERLAVALHDARVADGTAGPYVPHAEVKERLGLA